MYIYIYIYDCEWLQVKYIDRLSSLEAKVGAHRRGQFPGSGQAAGIPAGTAATGGLVCFLGVNTRLKIFLLQLFQYFLGSVYYFVRSNLKPETIISVHNFWDTLVIVGRKSSDQTHGRHLRSCDTAVLLASDVGLGCGRSCWKIPTS